MTRSVSRTQGMGPQEEEASGAPVLYPDLLILQADSTLSPTTPAVSALGSPPRVRTSVCFPSAGWGHEAIQARVWRHRGQVSRGLSPGCSGSSRLLATCLPAPSTLQAEQKEVLPQGDRPGHTGTGAAHGCSHLTPPHENPCLLPQLLLP